jgi:hypothetical protein
MNLTWYTNENLQELQGRGFRPASESEQGWFVTMNDGRKAWATDAPTNDDDYTDLLLSPTCLNCGGAHPTQGCPEIAAALIDSRDDAQELINGLRTQLDEARGHIAALVKAANDAGTLIELLDPNADALLQIERTATAARAFLRRA